MRMHADCGSDMFVFLSLLIVFCVVCDGMTLYCVFVQCACDVVVLLWCCLVFVVVCCVCGPSGGIWLQTVNIPK